MSDPALCGLAENPALPPDLLDRLVETADDDVAAELAYRADLTHAHAVALAARSPETAVLLAYRGRLTAADIDPAAQPDAALALLDEAAGLPEWARLLASEPQVARRQKLAACPGLPADVVERLASDPDIGVVAELAQFTTVREVVERLARHPHAEVRRGAAGNETAPPEVLAALVRGDFPPALRCLVCDREQVPFAHDPECPRQDCDLPPGAACDGSHQSAVHDMHYAALWNPATPAAAAAVFADHPSADLRWALAARTDVPPRVYEQLAADPVPHVRSTLAANLSVGEDLVRLLADDRGHDVQRTVAFRPDLRLDVLLRLAGAGKTGAATLPRITGASPDEVRELARSPQPEVRMMVAQRRDLPDAVRDALAADPDAKVVKSVAPHPGLSEAQLRAMVDRHGVRVVAKVAANPDASPELLEDLARHVPPVRKALREIARRPQATPTALLACLEDHQARPPAAGHPALPPALIAGLTADPDWQVAQAAAGNPSLPLAAMRALLDLEG
ncbi:hypothetical protein [Actinacidiphila bryophytorum]|uniref:Leucine rich repeat variant n=1 Tax=Actinacidiphila bryophytorum TaxID=1436133 RepID=A0A9W4H4A4_9ACTN|nr:hypothetical protein [Actinacidiphila bryophytorum]MBM9435858.1 hypothetical protein [Actinacidiphila bryophytorum]MBN6543293.1 hypothetical protein [Actinacidiphila bryophytorum]CAG7649856.1 Leucine rich repeat variant [Actinacidiphila bryophytorum]